MRGLPWEASRGRAPMGGLSWEAPFRRPPLPLYFHKLPIVRLWRWLVMGLLKGNATPDPRNHLVDKVALRDPRNHPSRGQSCPARSSKPSISWPKLPRQSLETIHLVAKMASHGSIQLIPHDPIILRDDAEHTLAGPSAQGVSEIIVGAPD